MKAWNIVLWILQILLAVMFALAGWMKLVSPFEQLNMLMPWTEALPEIAIRMIAVCELLGAVALILPSALRIMPQLTPYAAGALALVMLLAAIFHGMRGEGSNVGTNAVLGILAVVVAWGRISQAPISPRATSSN